MNSYFEQTGFYGHPHQTTGMGMGSGGHHDQTASYRGLPFSLGMPYTNPHLQRSTQDSPYDASISAACSKIYDGSYKQDCAKAANLSGGSGDGTNGYKDVWNTSGSNGSAGNPGSGSGSGSGQTNSVPVRPSACTPDSRVGYMDTSGGSPVSHRGGSANAVTGSAWNANCTISGAAAAAAAQSTGGLHQANHTFYPWMAIAGEFDFSSKNIVWFCFFVGFRKLFLASVFFFHLLK